MSEAAEAREVDPPLFVDLDGTLVKTDLLLESFLVLLKARPWVLFLLPLWLMKGRAFLKAEIARRADVSADALIYDEALLERLRAEHGCGRPLILATASNRKYADGVAAHLGIFVHVIASDETANMKGASKALAILAYTEGGAFDYAGNESADLPIWSKARRAICVDTPAAVVRAVKKLGTGEPEIFERARKSRLKVFVKAIRVHQWLKNALVFVPVAAAHRVGDVQAVLQVVAAFFAYSFLASSVYVLNDLTDLRSDRLHPRKRKRPFAAGDLELKTGLLMIPALLAASLAITLLVLPVEFLVVLGVYYACTTAYTFALKERVVWDVIMLAVLYVLRVIAGAAAVPVPPSFWLLAFSMFIFLSLALAKRYSEMVTMAKAGRSVAAGRGYYTDDMPVLQSMGVVAGYVAVLVIALYINSPEIHALYPWPQVLWGICPLLLFWVTRVWLRTHRGQMHDDPVVFAVRDPVSLVIGALTVGCLAAGALAP